MLNFSKDTNMSNARTRVCSRGPSRAEKAYEISKSLDFSDFYSDFKLISRANDSPLN